MVVPTVTSGQMKRINEILISSVPTELLAENAQALVDGNLRALLANFWSITTRESEVYEVTPVYTFADLARVFGGIQPNPECKKALVFPKPRGSVKPVRLRVLKFEDVGDSFESIPFNELRKELEKVDIEVASAPETLGFLAQECISPTDVLNERKIIALGEAVKDPLYDNYSYLIAGRKNIGKLTDKIHCTLMPAADCGLENWGFNLLVHA